MKPNLIQQIEAQTGRPLIALSRPNDLTQAIRYKNNGSYVLDEAGHLLALNLRGDSELRELVFDEDASGLQYLVLANNENLTRIFFEAPLPALRYADLSECQLTELSFPAGFSLLEKLYLQRNQLQRIEFRTGCPALLFLDANYNQLDHFTLPGGFDALAYLYLSNNQLVEVSFQQAPRCLEILHLSNNQLLQLPSNLLSFTALETLYLHDNPLPSVPKGASGIPVEKRENALSGVRNYLRSITEDKPMPNDEVKLVLLGNSTAGKSNLYHFLKTGRYEPDLHYSTHGLLHEIWQPAGADFKVNVWDFGGQEFYHATHRLFLSENAVSLVAFEAATNQQGESKLPVRVYRRGRLEEMLLDVEHFHAASTLR